MLSGKTELCDNVNIDWDLVPDDRLYDNFDYSDDDLDGGVGGTQWNIYCLLGVDV